MGEAIAGSYNFGGGYIGKHFSYGDICRRLGIKEPKHKKCEWHNEICIICHYTFKTKEYGECICHWCEHGKKRYENSDKRAEVKRESVKRLRAKVRKMARGNK